MNAKKEFGDYQTPLSFATKVCDFLKNERNIAPDVILEPTCGIGGFLKSGLSFEAKRYYGIEINPDYCAICRREIPDSRIEIINEDFFSCNLERFKAERLLVLGNPPWVNNSTLSTFNSTNLPQKSNFKGLKGLDALTGASNFDICEYIILRLLSAFQGANTTIAMLCKTSVARNVFKELKRQNWNFEYCDIIEFDAFKVFGISASACLLLVQLTTKAKSPAKCNLYDFGNMKEVKSILVFKNGELLNQLDDNVSDFDGKCCFEWRQGVKHDCAKVMELNVQNNRLVNGAREEVHIEQDIVFPLIKSSMFKKPVISEFSKYVIVTQRKVREDTGYIQESLPQTWEYLNQHKSFFDKRKSSIYQGAPDFSMFGVGEYSYARYKVGVSGFYKKPLFSVLISNDGKPVMTDDTSYFMCFTSYNDAYTAMLYLNSPRVQKFLKNIAFLDAKRPYTKKVLERIDFSKINKKISLEELQKTERLLGLKPCITDKMLSEFMTT